jgi:hypothetical protein
LRLWPIPWKSGWRKTIVSVETPAQTPPQSKNCFRSESLAFQTETIRHWRRWIGWFDSIDQVKPMGASSYWFIGFRGMSARLLYSPSGSEHSRQCLIQKTIRSTKHIQKYLSRAKIQLKYSLMLTVITSFKHHFFTNSEADP